MSFGRRQACGTPHSLPPLRSANWLCKPCGARNSSLSPLVADACCSIWAPGRSGLMRLRGDLNKVDIVITQMALESLQKKQSTLAPLDRPQNGVDCGAFLRCLVRPNRAGLWTGPESILGFRTEFTSRGVKTMPSSRRSQLPNPSAV